MVSPENIWYREYLLKAVQSFHSESKAYASVRGGKCSNGGTVPNTAFIFRAFVANPRSLSYLCIFSSFYLALYFILPGGE